MNAVGIDISKGKSTVAVLRPFGEIVAEPFDVVHNDDDLNSLINRIKSLSGETKVVMEYTGKYYEAIANALYLLIICELLLLPIDFLFAGFTYINWVG